MSGKANGKVSGKASGRVNEKASGKVSGKANGKVNGKGNPDRKKAPAGGKPVCEKRVSGKPISGMPENWFYLAAEPVTLEELRRALPAGTESDFWREAGVMEIVLGEKSSVDVETMELEEQDEETRAYLEEQGAKALYYVSLRPEELDAAMPCLRAMLACGGGKFLGDTPDLGPEIS